MVSEGYVLQKKNYTNPADRGRFGFSMSGEYRAPYKAEAAITIVLYGGAVLIGAILFFIIKEIYEKSRIEDGNGSAFVLVGGVLALLACIAVLILIFGVGVRSVKKGFKCQYNANDETFTANVGGDLHVIRYDEVAGVSFTTRTSFGKIRGYDVAVQIGANTERYSICSEGYLSPQATPFYIIQERIELLRMPHSNVEINNAKADNRAITRAEVDRAKTGSISAMDRMAQLLGETSNMPELSANPANGESTPEVVPKKNQQYSSADMPSVDTHLRKF